VFGKGETTQEAHPYLGPAADAGKGAVAEAVLEAVSIAVMRVLGSGLK
jgi:hypothetical protein